MRELRRLCGHVPNRSFGRQVAARYVKSPEYKVTAVQIEKESLT